MCLYCLSADGPFDGEEHIVPFALGNRDKILPPGVVCRPCNNGVLSRLDQTLMDFTPLAMMRVQLGLVGRDGKLPTARFSNAHLIRHPDDRVEIINTGGKPAWRTDPRDPNNHTLTVQGKAPTDTNLRDLTRALYKIGLGLIYLDHGRAFAHGPAFDEMRAMIRGEHKYGGFLLVSRDATPTAESTFEYQWVPYQPNGAGLVLRADFFGFRMITSVHPRRILDPKSAQEDGMMLLTFDEGAGRLAA